MSDLDQPKNRMSNLTWWLTIAGCSFLALWCEFALSVVLTFAPGWANEWPFGLSIYSVWSAGTSVLYFLLQMTSAVWLGAIIGAAGVWSDVGVRNGKKIFAYFLVVFVILAALRSWITFPEIYSTAIRMWPNGYNQ